MRVVSEYINGFGKFQVIKRQSCFDDFLGIGLFEMIFYCFLYISIVLHICILLNLNFFNFYFCIYLSFDSIIIYRSLFLVDFMAYEFFLNIRVD